MPEEEREDWELRPGELSIGHYVRYSPYDNLTDEQADALQAKLEELERRKIPIGFRASQPNTADGQRAVTAKPKRKSKK